MPESKVEIPLELLDEIIDLSDRLRRKTEGLNDAVRRKTLPPWEDNPGHMPPEVGRADLLDVKDTGGGLHLRVMAKHVPWALRGFWDDIKHWRRSR